jgi:hypothetical protein
VRPWLLAVGFFASGVAQAATFYVTVAGLGGEADYEQRFTAQAQEIDKLLHGSSSDAKVTPKWRGTPNRTTLLC